jgi:hypothetical protein
VIQIEFFKLGPDQGFGDFMQSVFVGTENFQALEIANPRRQACEEIAVNF